MSTAGTALTAPNAPTTPYPSTASVVVGEAPSLTASRATVVSPFAPGLPLTHDPVWHVARRLAHAATHDLVAEIRSVGPAAWIASQLDPASIDDSACDALLAAHFPWLGATPPELTALAWGNPSRAAGHVARATALRQLMSRRVLLESVVEFFGDLLYVPFTSDKCPKWVLDYDREVIRAHAMGTFREMLAASVVHPAMLRFLDNVSNTRSSVNENLGRELLELHTVGAVNPLDGSPSYTQDDVRASSLMLTGHTVDPGQRAARFQASNHYVGPITVMGFTHPNATATGGQDALDAYTDYLARHPLTARRVVTRLCVRFVSDTPPASLVDRLAATYLAHDTAVVPVLQQLFASAEFLGSAGQKVRRPAELTASALRAGRPGTAISVDTSAQPDQALRGVSRQLAECDHYPRGWPVVNGYPDVAPAWTSTQATLARMKSAYAVASQSDPEFPPTAPWATTLGLPSGESALVTARRLVVTLTGYQPSGPHRAALAAVLAGPAVSVHAPLTQEQLDLNCAEAVALVMASPYFLIR